jgi:hypothetical protein
VLAAIDDTANANEIARPEVRYVRAYGGHAPDDFMAGNAREPCARPFRAHLVQVGMANAAVGDLDLDVVRARRAAGNPHGFQGFVARMGTVGRDIVHEKSSIRKWMVEKIMTDLTAFSIGPFKVDRSAERRFH